MDWQKSNAKFDSTCRCCRRRLSAGDPAVMRKSALNGKWAILCPECYRDGKADFDAEVVIETGVSDTTPKGRKGKGSAEDVAAQIENLMKVLGRPTIEKAVTPEDPKDENEDEDPEVIFIPAKKTLADKKETPKKEPLWTETPWDEIGEAPSEAKTDGDSDSFESDLSESLFQVNPNPPPDKPRYTADYISSNPEWRI